MSATAPVVTGADEAVAVIDGYLAVFGGRSLVSADELVDILLDVRNHITGQEATP